MDKMIYNSKIDWWVSAIVIFTIVVCVIGSSIDGRIFITGLVMGVFLFILEIVMFASVKYQICDGKIGIRNFLYRWEWLPIDKITEVKKTRSILSAPGLSFDRIAIKFSDKKILKSSMPLEISPKDRDSFIIQLKEINPNIIVK